MRVLIDTNVFISHLLSPENKQQVAYAIMAAWLANEFTLLLPELLLEEIVLTVQNKRKLAGRIPPQQLQTLVTDLQEFGEPIPTFKHPIPALTRDRKDDYLLAYALVGDADYLVSGDKDLLVLQDAVKEVTIVAPHEFLELLAN